MLDQRPLHSVFQQFLYVLLLHTAEKNKRRTPPSLTQHAPYVQTPGTAPAPPARTGALRRATRSRGPPRPSSGAASDERVVRPAWAGGGRVPSAFGPRRNELSDRRAPLNDAGGEGVEPGRRRQAEDPRTIDTAGGGQIGSEGCPVESADVLSPPSELPFGMEWQRPYLRRVITV